MSFSDASQISSFSHFVILLPNFIKKNFFKIKKKKRQSQIDYLKVKLLKTYLNYT